MRLIRVRRYRVCRRRRSGRVARGVAIVRGIGRCIVGRHGRLSFGEACLRGGVVELRILAPTPATAAWDATAWDAAAAEDAAAAPIVAACGSP